jgi:cardiolipin synthase
MFDPKHVADLVTYGRGILAIGLVWLGISQGTDGLGMAVWLMLVDWIGDVMDGFLARRSHTYAPTWIGDHDLEVDITVSVGLSIYMLSAGYVDWQIGIGYLLLWILIFWKWGYDRSLGMLIQAPIYVWFIFLTLREPPRTGWWLIGWIVAIVIITWPRFPNEVVPAFLKNIRGNRKG